MLNDDTVVSPDFLDILVAEAEKDPLIGMLGPEVLCFRDRERVSFAGAKLDPVAGTFSFPRSGDDMKLARELMQLKGIKP